MNEINFDASADSVHKGLQDEIRSLRMLLVAALAVILLFSGIITVHFSRQAKIAKGQADEAEKVVSEFNSFGGPWANDFWNKLLDYSKTHPDFTPIVEKYRPYITAPPQPHTTTNAPKK